MANFYTNIGKITGPYTRILWMLFFILLFLVVGYFGYKKFFVQSNEKYTNIANANRRSPEIVILFFYADWCPHCTKAKPEWVAFSDEYNGKTVNNYIIRCTMVNCTDDSDMETAGLLSTYKVSSYPTVVMVKDSEHIIYDAKIKKDTLQSFLVTGSSS